MSNAMSSELRVLRLPDETDTNATLALISQARRSLAEARTLPDIRRVMEAASVATDAAQRAAKLAEAQKAAAAVVEAANEAANDAAAVRIEAQAKAGELLRQMAERGDRATTGDRQPGRESQAATLGELGVSKSESSRWQQVAAVPAETRGDYVEATKAANGEVSTAGLLRHASESAPAARAAGNRSDRQATVDHAAIAAAARKQVRVIYRELLALPGYRPEALVMALDGSERRYLLRSLDQLSTWIEDVRRELALHQVTKKEV